MQTLTIKEMVARRVEISEQLEQLEQEKQLIDDRLRELGQGTHDAGDWSVSVRVNRRLDPKAFEEAYPVVSFPQLYRPAPNLDAIKENVAPAQLDKFYRDGKPSVVVR